MAEELKPSTFYTVYGEPQLDQSKQDALLYLYQPIIGSHAASLYLTLISDVTLEGKSPSLMHTDLLAAIDIGLMHLVKAREHLEGIGLLETYQQTDDEIGMSLIYQLRSPVVPEKFFQDPLMSYLLMDKVGRRRYERLVERFKPQLFDKGQVKNITKRFREVYRLDDKAFASQTEVLEQTQASFSDNTDFDWTLFSQQLKRFNLILGAEEREKLQTFQTLYGVNELDLAEFVAKAAAGEKTGLNFNYLRQLINKEKRPKVSAAPKEPVTEKAVETGSFSPQESEIIAQSKKIAPVTFLRAIKREKGGFETNTEVRLLEELIGRNLLPKSVINIIINYILVIQNQAVINANYLNAIANDWAQKKITTPEAAITHVRENNQKLVRKPQASRPAYQKRGMGRKEALPEHIKQPPKETKLTPEKEAELNRKLAEYLNKEGDD
ncbi:replication initiation and membrane attachment [Enterococcus avium]|uniref:DnaD domain protein n=1 Tax=Enterococcus malodoratus TaxID=71451 RepID=UPI0008BA5F55|nr:DnaD domain protein [Enterococcus malodoratus]BBM18034.1 replication initiation and membrane attachment [Enterococcus avium]SET03841.1 replicative DNA helicase loader DnaB [Enterococcus malodoratus]